MKTLREYYANHECNIPDALIILDDHIVDLSKKLEAITDAIMLQSETMEGLLEKAN